MGVLPGNMQTRNIIIFFLEYHDRNNILFFLKLSQVPAHVADDFAEAVSAILPLLMALAYGGDFVDDFYFSGNCFLKKSGVF
jgi:hypothetical protein